MEGQSSSRRCDDGNREWREARELQAKECRQPVEAGKGKETGSPREPSESTQAHRHLDLGSARLILDVRFLGL